MGPFGAKISGCLATVSMMVGVADAQITATEASQEFMAIQCAISAGTSAENFRDYGAGLAVTLSTLDSTQQERVFGYLPTPVVAATSQIAAAEPSGEEAQEPNRGGQEEAGLLDGLIEKASEALGEILMPDSNVDPVIAGTPPSGNPEEANQDPNSTGGTEIASNEESEDPAAADGDGNNGHGNSGGLDPSNPGGQEKVPPGQAKKADPDGDGNNGHGNSGGYDPSNPGKSKK